MIRLFVALHLPADIQQFLAGLGRTIPGARLVPENQFHLTLRFIGEVDGAVYRDIKDALADISSPAITLAVKGVGHFPPRGKPKVLWAGIESTGDILILRNRVNGALRRCGIDFEQRKFHSHVTLARLNNSPPRRVAQFLAGNALLETPPLTINAFTLFSSVLGKEGAVHRVEAEYPLHETR